MHSSDHQQQWQKIEQMTHQLHELSAQENWQAMLELEAERQSEIKAYFADPVTEGEAADIAENIRKILHSDDLLVQHSEKKKAEAADAVQKLSVNKQAIKAYSHFEK